MKERLLDLLCCPECGKRFSCRADKTEGGEIVEGALACECGAEFPIIRGIPRILPKLERIKEKTAEGFGYEWKNYSRLLDVYKDQFLSFLGPHVTPDFFKDKLVLDAGCGMGRHAFWAAKWGAEVVAFDLGGAVDVAARNTRGLNVHVVQADIYHLPFPRQFDFAYSIGVLHHLPDGEKGFRSIVEKTRPGGAVFAWVYGKEGNKLLPAMLAARKLTTRLPLRFVDGLSLAAMAVLHPTIKIAGPLSGKDSFFRYLSGFGFYQNRSILFDQLLAPIANYYTREEFEKWFANAGLKPDISWRNQNSWRGFAKIAE